MNVLYVSSEASPYASTGGLGDVMGSMPSAVAESDERVTASVILPLHRCVKKNYYNKLEHLTDLSFNLSWRNTGASVYQITNKGVDFYFIENDYYFDRNSLYGEYDDAERYAFFSLAVVEFIKTRKLKPDILHANDWQSAMSVVYLKVASKENSELEKIKTAFTVHNIEHQGRFDPYILGDVFGLDNSYLPLMCNDGCINLMKAAMLEADKVITVSPNYACEITHDFFSYGLSSTVRSVAAKTVGILNGIDYEIFSPQNDDEIDFKYTKRTVRYGKNRNKNAVLERLSLEGSEERPLIVMVTRLTEQKGIDLLIHVLDELMLEDINLVILGSGETRYEDTLLNKSRIYSNLKVIIGFNRALSKQLYAAADIFLMPSKTEPCGIAQMIACAYGAVPLVRNTGGLHDTIVPYGLDMSNGFRFDNYNAHDFLFCIKRACEIYKNKGKWHLLRKNCINSDFSWSISAIKYVSVYQKMLEE